MDHTGNGSIMTLGVRGYIMLWLHIQRQWAIGEG